MYFTSYVLTYKSGLGGAEHSNWTIFIVVPVTSTSGWQAGRHVEVGANVSAYTNTNEDLTEEGNTQLKNVQLTSPCMLTFGVKALRDPVFPKHHVHPLAMATHKQSHLGKGRLTGWPQHLRKRFNLNLI